jgi:hypothetical protein
LRGAFAKPQRHEGKTATKAQRLKDFRINLKLCGSAPLRSRRGTKERPPQRRKNSKTSALI